MKGVRRWLALVLAVTLVASNALYQLSTHISASTVPETVAVDDQQDAGGDGQQEQTVVQTEDAVVQEVQIPEEPASEPVQPEVPQQDPGVSDNGAEAPNQAPENPNGGGV